MELGFYCPHQRSYWTSNNHRRSVHLFSNELYRGSEDAKLDHGCRSAACGFIWAYLCCQDQSKSKRDFILSSEIQKVEKGKRKMKRILLMLFLTSCASSGPKSFTTLRLDLVKVEGLICVAEPDAMEIVKLLEDSGVEFKRPLEAQVKK